MAEDVLFADKFEHRLSDQWQVEGLDKKGYRIRDGGLEMRVQGGQPKFTGPLIKVMLPFSIHDTVIASVRVKPLDAFTAEGEFAGIILLDESSLEFAAKQQRVADRLVYAPGKYVFQGKKGEEGDVDKYRVEYTDVQPQDGPLRIITRSTYAFFQVGPSKQDEYLNFFHSAVNAKPEARGFALVAAGAPPDVEHWVRFEDFRVTR
jgi:hypothetical protein